MALKTTEKVSSQKLVKTLLGAVSTLCALAMLLQPLAFAHAESAVIIKHSNATIVAGSQESNTDNATVRAYVQKDDVLTLTLDSRLWTAQTWLTSSFPLGTVDLDPAANTATFTFSRLENPQVVVIPVTISPSFVTDETLSPRSISGQLTEGDYSLDAHLVSQGIETAAVTSSIHV